MKVVSEWVSRVLHPARHIIQCESKKSIPWSFLTFFSKQLGICSPNFTRLLYVPVYTRLQIFIQLSATLTKLCHIKCDHPVHITKCHAQCPSSAETHTFRRLRKTSIAVGDFGSETSLSRQSSALVVTTQNKQSQDMTVWILDWIGLKRGKSTPKTQQTGASTQKHRKLWTKPSSSSA